LLRLLVPASTPRRFGFDPRSVNLRFVVDKVTIVLAFLRVLGVSVVQIIPPVLHPYLQVHLHVTRRRNERKLGTFHKVILFVFGATAPSGPGPPRLRGF